LAGADGVPDAGLRLPDDGAHGFTPPCPDSGAQGLAWVIDCPDPVLPELEAGAQGFPLRRPEVGMHGLARVAGWPGAQGERGPQGFRAACASSIGAATTGVGAGVVAAIVEARVERLPASSLDLIVLTGIGGLFVELRPRLN